MSSVIMRTGDLKPDLKVTLTERGGDPVDATEAQSIRIIGQRDGVTIFDRSPSGVVVVGDASVVEMLWQPTDTEVTGRILIEVEVTWPTNKPQTFRASNAIDVMSDFDA